MEIEGFVQCKHKNPTLLKKKLWFETMATENLKESLTRFDFFKIVLNKDLPTLELPKRFVRLHGANLRGSVSLETQNGSKWTVKVLKRDRKIWLQQEWPDFMKHFSIENGHLLFFRYKGNSKFKVSICDSSSCQIFDPFKRRNDDSVQSSESEEESEDESLSPPSQKRMRKVLFTGINCGSGSKPCKPSFTVTVIPTMVAPGYNWQIPVTFWKQHLAGKTDHVLLRDSEGNIWHVLFHVTKCGILMGCFSMLDWKKFVCDNNLMIGDSCGFELTNIDNHVSFDVTISRAEESSHPQDKSKCGHSQSGAKHNLSSKTLRCKSEGRFVASIKDGRSYNLRVDTIFDLKCFKYKNRSQMVTLVVGDRSWLVNLIVCGSRCFLSGGFLQFVEENSLVPGDVCVYELIDRVNAIVRVSLFPKTS